MTALLLDRLPHNVHQAKDKDPKGKLVIGEHVHDTGFWGALSKYGTFDQYFYLADDEPTEEVDSRLTRISPEHTTPLTDVDELVMFTSSQVLPKFVPLREFHRRRDWAICGLTHSLSLVVDLPIYLSLCVAELQSHDALICSAPNARQTLEAIFQGFEESSSLQSLQRPDIMLPTVPLGVTPSEKPSESRAELRQQLELPKDALIYFFLGRLSDKNKFDFYPLITTFLCDPELPQSSVLVIAGDDIQYDMRPKIEALRDELNGQSRVIVKPNVSTSVKSALLHASDVFVAMSDTLEETFGISVVEAMMAGLPVIASDWDGYRHLVSDGVDGILVPTYFHEDFSALDVPMTLFQDIRGPQVQRTCTDLGALTDALRLLARDASLRRRMGSAGRETAMRNYSWESVIGRCEEVWRQQVERGHAYARSSTQASSCAIEGKPAFYSYGKSFGMYPTKVLDDSATMRASVTTWPATFATDAVEDLVVEFVRQNGETSFGDLVDKFSSEDVSPSAIRARTSRLIKHGLLRLN